MKEYIKPVIQGIKIESHCEILSASGRPDEKYQEVYFDDVKEPEWGFHGFGDDEIDDEDDIL